MLNLQQHEKKLENETGGRSFKGGVGANAARTNLHEQGDQIEGFFFTPIG
jgi:hypothetical protein